MYSLSLITKQLHFSHMEMEGIFIAENNDFWQLASATMLLAKFHAGTRKSLSDFWPPLLEQSIKFVLMLIIREQNWMTDLVNDHALSNFSLRFRSVNIFENMV